MIRLSRTPYLWSLFGLGALGYLIQIRGQNVPLWIILLSLASMVAVFALVVHSIQKKHQQAQSGTQLSERQQKQGLRTRGKPRSKR